MLSQVEAVEQMLKIESSEQINNTLTNEELKTAGEMFLYLTMCPNTIKPWIVFYKELFQSQAADQIILTLNRLMQGPRTQTNEHFKELAEILLKRILSILRGSRAEDTASNTGARPTQSFILKHCHC